MQRRRLVLALMLAAGGCGKAPAPPAPHQIHIVGSIATYGFSTAAAERLMRERPEVIAPLVQAGGTADGIARFCAGIGPRFPDIVGTVRAMTPAEQARCAQNGVRAIETIPLGPTAFVLVTRPDSAIPPLTRSTLARALSTGARTWTDVDPALPALPILIDGPAPSVADDLTGPILPPGTKLRRDPAYRGHGADAGLIAAAVAAHAGAIGILPWREALAHADTLRILPLDGVTPSAGTIASGRYPASAPLTLLVKSGEQVPGLAILLGYYREAAASRL